MRVVVANSVGIGPEGERYIHFPSRWSAVEQPSWYDHRKGKMTFYPFMLAYCSALLKRDTSHDVKFLDGNLNDWDHEKYLKNILNENPDWLVMETSSLSASMDLKLAMEVKSKAGCKVIFVGQHPTVYPEQFLNAGVDYVVRGEYEKTVTELLTSDNPAGVEGVYPNKRRELTDPNRLPWPEDEDVARIDYMEPCISEYREIEMFASRGCPLACNFCVASNVYYKGAGCWRPRNVEDVAAEIAAMRQKYPEMEGIFFDDEMHNGKKEFTIKLCKTIIANGLADLKYNAMCGYWNLDAEILGWMRKAGYYKLRIGIETADKSVAREIQKSHSMKRLYNVLESAKKIGIKMYGTFTYGAKGSTAQKDRATTSLIKDLLEKELLFDLQISICTPQPGTPFFEHVESTSSLTTRDWKKYDGAKNVIQTYPNYSAKEILAEVEKARSVVSQIAQAPRMGEYNSTGLLTALKEAPCTKILVICTGPAWQTKKIVDELKQNGFSGKITLLIRNGSQLNLEDLQATRYAGTKLTLDSLDAKTSKRMKSEGYDVAVVQINHNSTDTTDYAEVFDVAESFSKRWIAIDINGNVQTGELALHK